MNKSPDMKHDIGNDIGQGTGTTASNTSADWTNGGNRLVFQHCGNCQNTWYFKRSFCPACGDQAAVPTPSTGRGLVHASTLVQRAASDEFRAIAPYRIVLVDLAEGFRVMAHGDKLLLIGDRVQCQIQHIAGRPLPFFNKETS